MGQEEHSVGVLAIAGDGLVLLRDIDGAHDAWIEGGLESGAMRLVGQLVDPDGSSASFRGAWTPLADGRVRQFFEQSADRENWTPWFDGYYKRKEGTGD